MGFNYCNVNDVKNWLAGLDVSEMPTTLDLIIEQNIIPWAKRQIDTFIGENLDSTTITEHYDGTGKVELCLNHRPISFLRKCVLRIIPACQWYEFKRWYHINTTDQLGIKIAEAGGVAPVDASSLPIYTFPESALVPDDLKVPSGNTGTFSSATSYYEQSDLFVNCKLGLISIPPRIMYLDNQAIPFWNYTWLRGYGNIEVVYDYGYKNLDSLPQEIRSACAQFVAAAVLLSKGQFSGGGMTSLTLGAMPRSFGEVQYAGHIRMYLESAKATLLPYKRLRV